MLVPPRSCSEVGASVTSRPGVKPKVQRTAAGHMTLRRSGQALNLCPPLGIFKTRLDKAPRNLLWLDSWGPSQPMFSYDLGQLVQNGLAALRLAVEQPLQRIAGGLWPVASSIPVAWAAHPPYSFASLMSNIAVEVLPELARKPGIHLWTSAFKGGKGDFLLKIPH